jgi:hypothetical protein
MGDASAQISYRSWRTLIVQATYSYIRNAPDGRIFNKISETINQIVATAVGDE